jgi:hypothetical protein
MIFYTVAFNDEYIPYLKVLIESINQNVPDSTIIVGYDGLSYIPDKYINVIYHNIKFDFNLNVSYTITPGLKLSFLLELVNKYKHSEFTFIDCDMLVLKSFNELFTKYDFNVGYTYKTDEDEGLNYLLNTGITLYKNCPVSFFENWKLITDTIQSNPALNASARAEWGAADQAALASIIGNKYNIGNSPVNRNNLIFQGFPCKLINETRCTEITEQTSVVHYKSGWRTILKNGKFTKNRPQIKCQKMYDLWFKYFNEFNSKIV